MSNSYKKNAFCSYEGSKKNKQLHNRRERHLLKQVVNTCLDWDNLILPKFFPEDWMCSCYQHWCRCEYNIPAYNECEVDIHKSLMQGHIWSERYLKDGHFTWCNCFSNKRSRWWKAKRK